jgi:ComEC/Rec2-related protein
VLPLSAFALLGGILTLRRRSQGWLLAGTALLFAGHALPPPQGPLPPGPVALQGEVVAELGGRRTRYVLEVAQRRLLVSATQPLPVGAEVEVQGWCRPPNPPQGALGYDEQAHFARRGWSGRLRAERVRVRRGGGGVLALREAVRRALRAALVRGAPGQHGTLGAMLLGDPIQGELRRAFARVGVAHLLSLSGLHVGLVALLALLALRLARISPTTQRVGAALTTLAFLALVGVRPPTLRAATAAVAFLLLPGRGDSWNRLAAALVVVLAVDPSSPRDLGLQLSFGTVAGLIALGGVGMRAKSRWSRGVIGAATAFAASTPLLAARLGQVPWVGLALSPLAIALFAPLLALSLVGAGLGVLLPELGALPLACAEKLAEFLVTLVRSCAAVAPAELIRPPSPVVVVVAMGALALGAVRMESGRRWRPWLVVGVLLATSWCLPAGREAEHVAVVADRGVRTILVATPQGAEWIGQAPSDRWVVEALGVTGSPRLARGILRRIELPGGVLLCWGRHRVLWVERPPPADSELPPVDVLVVRGKSAKSDLRRWVARTRPSCLLGEGGVARLRSPSIVEVDPEEHDSGARRARGR